MELLTETIAHHAEHADLVLPMLNRREAVDSSQIEGTQTGFDGLLIHEIEAGSQEAESDPDAEETFSYVRAFMRGCGDVERHGQDAPSLDLIRALHATLMEKQPRARPGEWRDVQNFIGSRLETARYVPPPAAAVPELMQDLQRVLRYQPDGVVDVSILMRAGIAHAQFEAIHPFLDGNGRTGRLLLPLMLKAAGLPPIHLATFLKVRQRDYYDALWQVQTRLNWAPWMTLFLECTVASCRHTVQLFSALQRLQTQWRRRLAEAGKRRHAAIWKVTDLLLGQPVVNVNIVAERLGVSFPAANTAITDLVALDILRPATDRRRHRIFHAHGVMNALYTGLDAVLDDVSRWAAPQP
ncbi:Fic family protein [Propionivibrio dicarboxylicus]|uniref:Fic family protein n=1 Tax=Propionivibrio dicarboxylicus TaxID=83767 RepID=UPI0015A2AE98|nr:Fic family protein [Propionivibrio dicarboxylicus]